MLELLYQALAADVGVVVSCPEGFEKTRAAFYRERTKAGDPSLDALTFRKSVDNPDELWIVRNAKTDGQAD